MLKFDANKLAGLIDSFYEAATRPELWRDLLAQFADALGAEGCGILGAPNSGFEPMCSASMDEALDFGMRSGWLEKNPRMSRGLEAFRRGHAIVTESTLFSEWELDHLPFNAEYVHRVKGRWFADMVIAGGGPSSVILTTQRLVGNEPFSKSELEALRQVAPHFRRAGELALRFAKARHEGLLDVFAAFDCGIVLLDGNGRVIRLNAKAEAMTAQGLALRWGVLTAVDKRCDAALQSLIGSVVARGSRPEAGPVGAVTISLPDARPLVVYAAPLVRSARDLFQQAAAVLMIAQPAASSRTFELFLTRAFHFTGAEAAIGAALCDGHDIDGIARMRGVTPATVRAQVKSMLTRTNTRRQVELVALLARYAAAAR